MYSLVSVYHLYSIRNSLQHSAINANRNHVFNCMVNPTLSATRAEILKEFLFHTIITGMSQGKNKINSYIILL